MNPARHLVLVGPMGAGKTSIGRCLARHFGLAFADSDHEVERHTGADIPTIFECEGERGFRAREREALATLLQGPPLVLATGGGALLDPGNRRLLAASGFVVHLRVDVPAQLERLARDRSRPLLAGGDRRAILQRLAA
ncbi:MAG: shikimate kinase, partial [Gammaproteobacteria bacterium]|nr:shikimate kinase [Gammaproteobacteria bacterium]